VNLGWKLAQLVHETSPENLLETYHAERHSIGARVLRNTRAIGALERNETRIQALREMMSELLQKDEARK
jgi:2-polyprenyl-6-methoxyphenol hydroxylase-like FAD-dependent oxidoreductase